MFIVYVIIEYPEWQMEPASVEFLGIFNDEDKADKYAENYKEGYALVEYVHLMD